MQRAPRAEGGRVRLVKGGQTAVPFLKWAGGKSQLLSTFADFYPTRFNRYFEPFIGGGAVFFNMANRHPGLKAFISDSNEELINCYQLLRNEPQAVIDALKEHRNDEEYFYKIRALNPLKLTPHQRAARLIFLNKTCFNGLYRVNRKGQFNTPFGKYKNPKFLDIPNIMQVNRVLSTAEIKCQSFDQVARKAKEGDFVYLDPPYHPLNATSNFVGYTKGSFNFEDQERLAEMYRTLSNKGCYVMLSNSNSEAVRELYADYRIETVMATRSINCNAQKRGRISEILVLNY